MLMVNPVLLGDAGTDPALLGSAGTYPVLLGNAETDQAMKDVGTGIWIALGLLVLGGATAILHAKYAE